MELFVADFSLVSLTFVVYDWDGPLVGDDFLGAAKLNMERVRLSHSIHSPSIDSLCTAPNLHVLHFIA